MEFKVEAKELRSLVSELYSIAKPDSKADVKTGVALELENGLLTLRICDLQGTFYSVRKLNVAEINPGSSVADLIHLNTILSVQKGGITLELPQNDNGVLKQKRTNLTIYTIPHQVHSIDPPVDEKWHYLSEADKVARAIAQANRNRDSEDDPRYAIGGIAIQSSDGYMEVIGSNGNSISVVTTDMPLELKNQDIIVARPELATTVNTYDKNRNLNICFTDEGIWLKQNERLDLVGIVQEVYPNYRDIVDPDPISLGFLERETLLNLKSVLQKNIIESDMYGNIWLHADGEGIKIGENKEHMQDISCTSLKFDPIKIHTDSFVSLLNMFTGDIDFEINNDSNHLYMRRDEQFAVLVIEDMKND
jgi:DNA polymerase III sliding clamp (beta) subunit (PCNA family)